MRILVVVDEGVSRVVLATSRMGERGRSGLADMGLEGFFRCTAR